MPGVKSTNFDHLLNVTKEPLVNTVILRSIHDDLESLFERCLSNTIETRERKNEYRPLYLFRLLDKSEDKKFLCSLTYDDSRSRASSNPRFTPPEYREVYDGKLLHRVNQVNPLSPDKFDELLKFLFPSFNITTPFFPVVETPLGVYVSKEIDEEKLNENLLTKYPYLESKCNRFTFYL